MLIEVFNKQLNSNPDTKLFVPNAISIVQNLLIEMLNGNYSQPVEEQAFQMLRTIVENKTIGLEAMLPCIIQFCMQFHAAITSNLNQEGKPTTETVDELYTMIDRILFYNFSYFIDSKVNSMAKKLKTQDNFGLFLSLFEILVQSFEREETDLVRENIISIRNLNSQFKLFELVNLN
jgi:hypothetical protein